MPLDGDFIARLHDAGFPALGSHLTDRAHFERPICGPSSGGIHDGDVQPAMRIGPFEFRQRPRNGDRLFMIKHREGMMSLTLNGERRDCNGDKAGDFPVHDVPPSDSLAAPISIVFPGFDIYHH